MKAYDLMEATMPITISADTRVSELIRRTSNGMRSFVVEVDGQIHVVRIESTDTSDETIESEQDRRERVKQAIATIQENFARAGLKEDKEVEEMIQSRAEYNREYYGKSFDTSSTDST